MFRLSESNVGTFLRVSCVRHIVLMHAIAVQALAKSIFVDLVTEVKMRGPSYRLEMAKLSLSE
jgi:hypothetical protein